MKKILTLALALGYGQVLMAQNDAVTSAFFYKKDGKLDKAKEEIDRASVNEKTMAKAKTWYFKAQIYRDIANSPLPAYKALDAKALAKSYEAYSKVLEIEKGDGEYSKSSKKEIEEIWGMALNEGVKNYQDKKYLEALESYDIAAQIKPGDTTAILYSSFAAEAVQDYGKVKTYYDKLFALNRRTVDMYRTLSSNARLNEKNDAKALEIVQEGRKYFPNDKNLALEELNLYFTLGKVGEAKGKLQEALKLDPNNPALLVSLGTILDQESNDTKKPAAERAELKKQAVGNYVKTLELDSRNFDANFNMGVYYFNQGAEVKKKVNAMTMNDYTKNGKKLEEEAKGYFQKALPYFVKANSETPADKATKQSLKKTYMSLGQKADADRIED